MTSPQLLALATATALAFVAGCDSGPRATVYGIVCYDGQPVDQGGIAWIPLGDASGRTGVRATGEIADGRYELDSRRGPLPGRYRVEITWQKKTGRQVRGEAGHPKDETKQVIPVRYNGKSELIREVKAGGNPFDFDLPK
jgi:hypothetical protein